MRIETQDECEMARICAELCKQGVGFVSCWSKGTWVIELNGAF